MLPRSYYTSPQELYNLLARKGGGKRWRKKGGEKKVAKKMWRKKGREKRWGKKTRWRIIGGRKSSDLLGQGMYANYTEARSLARARHESAVLSLKELKRESITPYPGDD